jgi:tRNA (guanine-N7-)-methyltransferase
MQGDHIRTFKLRRGRLTPGQAAALVHGSVLTVDAIDVAALPSPLLLDIGFGFGEATLALAQVQPELHVIAIDVHTPGIGNILRGVAETGVSNITVVEGDAVLLLHRLHDASLKGIRAFFPDPWPKARHHKRRLVNEITLREMARCVEPSGFLHVATDWLHYADAIDAMVTQAPEWTRVASHPLADPAERPTTRFERRGVAAGRIISDVVAVRT